MNRSRVRRIIGQLGGPLDSKDPGSISRRALLDKLLRKTANGKKPTAQAVAPSPKSPSNKARVPRSLGKKPSRISSAKKPRNFLTDKRLFRLSEDIVAHFRQGITSKMVFRMLQIARNKLEARTEDVFCLPVMVGGLPLFHWIKTPQGIRDMEEALLYSTSGKYGELGFRFDEAKAVAALRLQNEPVTAYTSVPFMWGGKNAGTLFFLKTPYGVDTTRPFRWDQLKKGSFVHP